MGFWDSVVDFFEDDVGGGIVDVGNQVVSGAGTVISEVAGGAVKVYEASWGGLDYVADWTKTSAAATSSWVTSVAGDAADFSVDSYNNARSWCVGAWQTLQGLLMGSPPRLGAPNPLARQCMATLFGAGISDAVVSAWERDASAKGYTMAIGLRGTFSFGAGATAVSGIYVDSTGAWGFFAEAGGGVGLPLPDASFTVELWMIFAGREAYSEKYFMPGLTLKIPTTPGSAPGGGVGQHETPDSGANFTFGGNALLTASFSFRGFRVQTGLSLVPSKIPLSPGSGPMSTNLAAVRVAQEGPGYDAAVRVQQQPASEQAILVTAMAAKAKIHDVDALCRFDFVRLRSWKGDCLHRPDGPQGVTTYSSGVGNVWRPVRAPGGAFLLKSWKDDYLHRPDSPENGVTTWAATGGSLWTLELVGDKVDLRSWKGDYLHRPDSPQGVTTWVKGGGSDWILEGLPGRQPPGLQGGWRTCTRCQGLFFGGANWPSVCPKGGAHQAGADEHRLYMGNVPRTLPGVPQDRWRWCQKCGGLHYIGGALGACPAGGVHTVETSGDYWNVIGDVDTPLLRPGFRWCSRCQGLWYPAGGASQCPAGGAHISTGSGPCTVLKTLRHYTTAPIDDAEQLLDFASFMLRSWKGDYLHRPDGSQSGVTTWPTGTTWKAERGEGAKIILRSWKGDCLHRPDAPSGVTTWTSGVGNEWTVVPGGATVGLRSWKGDFLHRPDSPQGVTTWTAGGGSDWFVEAIHPAT